MSRGWSSAGRCVHALAVSSLLLVACANERARPSAEACVTWSDDVAEALRASCADCHDGDAPAGGYRVTAYLDAIGGGSDDVPNAIAGDASSRLLTAIDPATATAPHAGLGEVHEVLSAWIVRCELALSSSPIHERGILDPRSEDFHGELLRRTAWDFARCAECHGEDFGGGTSERSCTTCHAEGPTACATCHGDDLLASGAHAAHLDASQPLLVQCERCHVTPAAWDEAGHVFRDGALDAPPAEVRLTGLADATPAGSVRSGPPAFDAATETCANVYCHGATLADAAATITMPRWTGGPAQAECGTCHGAPPADHAQDACATCHGDVIAADGTFVAPELHVDGALSVGRAGSDGCGGCHGAPDDGRPFSDLAGQTDTSLVTVGAHTAHLAAPFRLRGPLACADCHVVPASVTSIGHVDSPLPAEVFPGGAVFGGIASAGGATPAWDRAAGTCRDVHCHGGREPPWTAFSPGEIACGACHGVPPLDPAHTPDMSLTDCATCHPSVDAYGNPILTGPAASPVSAHLDGVVDVR